MPSGARPSEGGKVTKEEKTAFLLMDVGGLATEIDERIVSFLRIQVGDPRVSQVTEEIKELHEICRQKEGSRS